MLVAPADPKELEKSRACSLGLLVGRVIKGVFLVSGEEPAEPTDAGPGLTPALPQEGPVGTRVLERLPSSSKLGDEGWGGQESA